MLLTNLTPIKQWQRQNCIRRHFWNVLEIDSLLTLQSPSVTSLRKGTAGFTFVLGFKKLIIL